MITERSLLGEVVDPFFNVRFWIWYVFAVVATTQTYNNQEERILLHPFILTRTAQKSRDKNVSKFLGFTIDKFHFMHIILVCL